MDWSKPVAKRTRQSEALYFRELHKRIKLEKSSGGGGGGGFESGSECGGSFAGGLKRCSGGVERGREVISGFKRKGKIEIVSDEEYDDDVVWVGTISDFEGKGGDKVGVSVKDSGVDVELVDGGDNVETLEGEDVVLISEDDEKAYEVDLVDESENVETMSPKLQTRSESEDVALLISEDEARIVEEKVEEGNKLNEVVLESEEEEEEEVDSNRMSDSDYEINELNKEMEYGDGDDDGFDFVERPQKKTDCHSDYEINELNEEMEYDDGDHDDHDDGFDFVERPQKKTDCSYIAQEIGKWIYWNEDQRRNGWIAYHIQVEYVSNSIEEDGVSVNDSNDVKSGTADGDTQQQKFTKEKGIKVKHNTHGDLVGTSKNNSSEFDTASKSYSKSKMTEDGTRSQPFCIEEEEEDDSDSIPKQMSKRRKLGKITNSKRSRPLKCSEVLQVLVDSMLNGKDIPSEEVASQQHTVPSTANGHLPRLFTFGVPKTDPPYKSEFEKKLDELWTEFDFALAASEINTTNLVDQRADYIPEQATKNTASYCHNGNHMFLIDEEIGVKCKYCSLVKLEMRHFTPSFSKYPYGRFEKKLVQDEDNYVDFNGIPFEDVDCISRSDCGLSLYPKGTVWDLIPDIRKGMHPHQQEGFEFIWKNIAGGIYLSELQKRTCSDSGNGCIISHAPGTGKSRLTIVFLQTYIKLYPTCRPVIIAPRSMLLSWEAELRKWKVGIPFHNLIMPDLSGNENVAAINLLGQGNHHINSIRLLKLYSWKKDGGILGLSYKLYECLVDEKSVERKGKGRNKSSLYLQEIRKILLEAPNLLVLDEGHTPRNEKSLIWKALCKIQTEKRIILSGTPFQNNFEELFNTLCLVRPKFADSIQSDCYGMRRTRGRKVSAAKGKWCDLTSPIGKLEEGKASEYNLEELKYLLESFVHIYKGNILQKSLPGLRDSVIVLRPAEFQKDILEGLYRVKSTLRRNYVASLVSLHPSLLPESERVLFSRDKYKFERFKLNPEAGAKTKFLMELVRLSKATKEKVLVFSEYIKPLNFIRDMLKSHFGWTEGEEILYMDGQIDVRQRQSSINTFNDLSSEAGVLLASMKACSEGINLVGASRVVLLDVVWNPSVERQAISRAYRLGQKRVVHVYQLISGTIERDKYCLQAKKSLLSELVFSSTDRDENAHGISNAISGDNILEEMVQHKSLKDMIQKIIPQSKESSLIETFSLVDQEDIV